MAGGTATKVQAARRLVACGLACVALLGIGGCGGKPKKSKAGGSATSEKLPAVDLDTALAVDDGRIAVASPTGWTRLPRSKDCLVKYQPGPKKSYPKILVMAEAAPAEFPEVTADNHQAFAAAIGEGVTQMLGKAKPLKKATAVKLGPHFGVAWGLPGSARVDGIAEPIERWNWAVVTGGRMYTVEARAPKGKIDDAGKAAAKAVAAALAPPASVTVEPPAGEPPAEEKPPAVPADDADGDRTAS